MCSGGVLLLAHGHAWGWREGARLELFCVFRKVVGLALKIRDANEGGGD